MKQFKTIFMFEFLEYVKSKAYIIITALFVAAIAAIMFIPSFLSSGSDTSSDAGTSEDISSDETDTSEDVYEDADVILLAADWDKLSVDRETIVNAFSSEFYGYQIMTQEELNLSEVEEMLTNEQAVCAFVFENENLTPYTYYVFDEGLYTDYTETADEILNQLVRQQMLVDAGVDESEAASILSIHVSHDTVSLGQDQSSSFLYAYIMVMAMYMITAMYGGMVANKVAAEKDSRVMELLISNAKPTALMFGKVFASCAAGLLQLAVVFGSAMLLYHLNFTETTTLGLVFGLLFDIPAYLLGYMLLFFLLGFLVYAFLFGAVGSIVSKLEDLGTVQGPVMMIFVVAFTVVIGCMSSGSVDSTIMIICSFVPLTSPMAMFTRIAMSTVPAYEIAISIALLVVFVYLVGRLTAKIYRAGVLMYGKPPKFFDMVR